VAYTNEGARPVQLVLEPWAEAYVLAPGQRANVIVRGESPIEFLECEQREESFFVYGQTGQVVDVEFEAEPR